MGGNKKQKKKTSKQSSTANKTTGSQATSISISEEGNGPSSITGPKLEFLRRGQVLGFK